MVATVIQTQGMWIYVYGCLCGCKTNYSPYCHNSYGPVVLNAHELIVVYICYRCIDIIPRVEAYMYHNGSVNECVIWIREIISIPICNVEKNMKVNHISFGWKTEKHSSVEPFSAIINLFYFLSVHAVVRLIKLNKYLDKIFITRRKHLLHRENIYY